MAQEFVCPASQKMPFFSSQPLWHQTFAFLFSSFKALDKSTQLFVKQIAYAEQSGQIDKVPKPRVPKPCIVFRDHDLGCRNKRRKRVGPVADSIEPCFLSCVLKLVHLLDVLLVQYDVLVPVQRWIASDSHQLRRQPEPAWLHSMREL